MKREKGTKKGIKEEDEGNLRRAPSRRRDEFQLVLDGGDELHLILDGAKCSIPKTRRALSWFLEDMALDIVT
uniref:Uncharacterized protein n=1 Tax=Oryza rufipogon TaxID=4529 RepID=A0A0E0Q5T4_ORYRU